MIKTLKKPLQKNGYILHHIVKLRNKINIPRLSLNGGCDFLYNGIILPQQELQVLPHPAFCPWRIFQPPD